MTSNSTLASLASVSNQHAVARVDLTPLTTFRTAASAQQLLVLKHRHDLLALPSQLANKVFIVLGSGSNVLFVDDFAGVVVHNALTGMTILTETAEYADIRLAAGEIWHDSVKKLSQSGFYGLENLALIPGTVGAAPVQNIGAYGVEIADFIQFVEVFDLATAEFVKFSASDCQFAYRHSVFKRHAYRQRYIITAVVLRLHKQFAPVLSYHGLLAVGEPQTPADLLAQVITLRQQKLPDPAVLPNAGSFFKNPVVTHEVLASIQQQYTNVPYFTVDATQVKIPAAWLLEQAGFKGHARANGAGVYEKHALILVNRGDAHGREIYALACDMMKAVKQQFGIDMVAEVRLVGASD